jgi:sugar phosphate isomerase/epimerase
VCVAGYNNFNADPEHTDVPQNEMQIAYITELARLTADLGGDTLRVFTAYEQKGIAFAAQWQHVVNAIKECCKRAAEFGVTIGVQNHHDIAVGVESQYQLIQAVNEPNCKALFDAWAPALQGADLTAAAQRMAPITSHTTVANYQVLPRYQYQKGLTNYATLQPWLQAVPVNEGFIDYQEFLTALHAAGFRGSVAYEMCSPLRSGGTVASLDEYARQFIDFISELRTQLRPDAVLA